MTRAGAPDDPLARALRALGEPPPPPPVGRLLARLHAGAPEEARWAGPLAWARPTRVALAAVAVFAVVVAVLVRDAVLATRREEAAGRGGPLVGRVLEGSPRALRADRAIPVAEAAAGDALRADAAARVELASGVVAALDAGAGVVLEGPDGARVTEGRVRFDTGARRAPPDAAGLVVRTRTLVVRDVGTRFGVDVSPDGGPPTAGERVRVTVEEGRVEAGGVALERGLGRSFVDGRPEGPAWPLDARPTIALEAETAAPTTREPVVLRIVLRNPTGGWIALPEPDPVRAPLWVEVAPPGGTPAPVRVTADLLVPGDRPPTAIPPRGETSLRLRFDRTFASPGTYRLRAVYRPAGAVERPASPEVQLTVR